MTRNAMIIVSYSKAHEMAREIGQYDTMDEAEEAARAAGAVGEAEKNGRDYIYNVEGHEGDDDYGIWIECPR